MASEQCSCFTSSNAGCWVCRGTFFFGHGGNLLLLTTGEEVLWVFDKCFLLIVCDTASLLDSKAVSFSQHDVHPTPSALDRGSEVCKSSENISSPVCSACADPD